jgi:hypothetical protein
MASAASLRDALTRLAETLIIGAASGAVLGLAHFPAGWLSGAIIAVAAARCCAGQCWSPMAELQVGMGRAYRADPTCCRMAMPALSTFQSRGVCC